MPIRRKTPKGAEERFVRRRTEDIIERLVDGLVEIAEETCRTARTSHRYQDQTGNLSSSIGYCILRDGEIIREGGFEVVKDGAEGAARGREYLRQLAPEHPNGIVLLIVAGMEYSAYVEAMGLDVLDSARIRTRELVRQLLSSLGL